MSNQQQMEQLERARQQQLKQMSANNPTTTTAAATTDSSSIDKGQIKSFIQEALAELSHLTSTTAHITQVAGTALTKQDLAELIKLAMTEIPQVASEVAIDYEQIKSILKEILPEHITQIASSTPQTASINMTQIREFIKEGLLEIPHLTTTSDQIKQVVHTVLPILHPQTLTKEDISTLIKAALTELPQIATSVEVDYKQIKALIHEAVAAMPQLSTTIEHAKIDYDQIALAMRSISADSAATPKSSASNFTSLTGDQIKDLLFGATTHAIAEHTKLLLPYLQGQLNIANPVFENSGSAGPNTAQFNSANLAEMVNQAVQNLNLSVTTLTAPNPCVSNFDALKPKIDFLKLIKNITIDDARTEQLHKELSACLTLTNEIKSQNKLKITFTKQRDVLEHALEKVAKGVNNKDERAYITKQKNGLEELDEQLITVKALYVAQLKAKLVTDQTIGHDLRSLHYSFFSKLITDDDKDLVIDYCDSCSSNLSDLIPANAEITIGICSLNNLGLDYFTVGLTF